MTANRFFVEKKIIPSRRAVLEGEEHNHLSRVIRKKPGDAVFLFDSTGTTYLAKIESISRDRTELSLIKKVSSKEAGTEIVLGQAMLKLKKMEFILQKTTELGISTFIPIRSERTIMKIKDGWDQKLLRWKKICLSAAKQSGRSTLVKIVPPVSLEEVIVNFDSANKIVLSEKAEKSLKEIILFPLLTVDDDMEIPPSTIILIGPEGGWTDKEEEYIVKNGFTRVSLGDQVLRSETAAISAVSAFSLFWK
ncbi:MAG: 16S rRNA (uracil(1498)-N(3))-methyltransferase [Candidatus Aminicenantes bacterium]|nr:16S rRNA (uracil(1498)-N(3))-methyltransferase [Candidatus Aminicenantes bacterium]